MTTSIMLNNWKLTGQQNGSVKANVPGDISFDLYAAGIISNPYYGINHLDHGWIIDSDFVYETKFDVFDDIMAEDEVILEFEGIDTFSEIYLNGEKLGNTDNMFLAYSYSVKDLLKKQGNVLKVKMISTTKEMSKVDKEGYFGTFNVERLFIRKAQCHFGWDWAPDMPGYGIYKPVKLYGASSRRINDVTYKSYNDGSVTFIAEMNYNTRSLIDFHGVVISEVDDKIKNDVIRYTLATEPDKPIGEASVIVKEQKVTGERNFINFKIDNPKLWWPVGYGEHPLYSYKVELVSGDTVLDCKEGRMAFREVKLSQKPIDDSSLEYKIVINGKPVFIKGTNWVPVECFTGTVRNDKYEKLIKIAKDGNLNMLRVWGGGIYEYDVFYDICDELGLMVWQDMMFACADIPEDIPEFVENCKKEINYQIKRLRNHPSIVYWCGGNEKTGSYGLQISKGDYFIDVILRGIIINLDDTRPFARQSPCSITDVGNDMTSGESHAGSYEACLIAGVDKYRDCVSEKIVPFVSECAIMGPGSLETLKKTFPEDKLWPINEYWHDRLMDNPYAAVVMPFADRQKFYADNLYGETKSIEDFICKGMTTHAETLRAEAEYARFNKGRTWGFMNWMFSDIWPSGTWSIVDYYGEPKQAYYQLKRSYEPKLLTFVQANDGKTYLSLINDTKDAVNTVIEYGLKTLDGEIIWSDEASVSLDAFDTYKLEVEKEFKKENTFLYAKTNNGSTSTVYSHSMWQGCKFESDYTYTINSDADKINITFKANKFAKGITVRLPDNYKYSYSDNYIDIPAGEEATITIYEAAKADEDKIIITDFAKETSNV